MNTIKHFTLLLVFTLVSLFSCEPSQSQNTDRSIHQPPRTERKVQVALLLDTSSSMDGLIEQAKSRLWNIVNTMTTLKIDGATPEIEIALYEYGNDNLSKSDYWIRQVAPLTTDLDLISEKLFALRTNGGLEYCGAVIKRSLDDLNWTNSSKDIKLIYIAGNESYAQGPVSYKEISKDAISRNIYINTIYCGNYDYGIKEMWKDGAEKGEGKYFNIDANKKVRYIVTPYDDEITRCNMRLNETYYGYGRMGMEKKAAQIQQDQNAASIGQANMAERAVVKSKAVYKNSSWDIVDAVEENEVDIAKLKDEELPAELKGKSVEERKKFIEEKAAERKKIQKELEELSIKRQKYIDEEMKKTGSEDDLGNAISKSIIEFAEKIGYKQG